MPQTPSSLQKRVKVVAAMIYKVDTKSVNLKVFDQDGYVEAGAYDGDKGWSGVSYTSHFNTSAWPLHL